MIPLRPDIRFISIDRPTNVRGGSKVDVRWETRLVRPGAPVIKIDFSSDGGASWARLVDDMRTPAAGHGTFPAWTSAVDF